MKKIIALLTAAVLFTSCSKEESTPKFETFHVKYEVFMTNPESRVDVFYMDKDGDFQTSNSTPSGIVYEADFDKDSTKAQNKMLQMFFLVGHNFELNDSIRAKLTVDEIVIETNDKSFDLISYYYDY